MATGRFSGIRGFDAAKNAIALALIQGVNLLTPLITLPYVLRILDLSGYGKVIIYQALAQYFSILIDFGFQLSATRHIAIIRNDKSGLADYCSTVQSCRMVLAVVSVFIGLIIYLVFPVVQRDSDIYLACLISIVGTLLTPMWLFAGLERIAAAAIAVATAKVCAIPLTFLFVHGPDDAWRFALINSMSIVLGGLACLFLILRWRLVESWVTPRRTQILVVFRDAWHYFITIAAATFYSASNPLLLGLVSSSTQVAYFGAADRVRTMSLAPLQPISNAYYPVLSRLFASDATAAFSLLRRLFWLLVGGMAVVSSLLFLGAPFIVDLLMGPKYADAVPVLRIMAAIPLVIGVNTAIGPLTMLAMGMKKEVSLIILVCGAGNLALISFLGKSYGASGAAAALLATETMVAICLGTMLYRRLRRDADASIPKIPLGR